MNCFTSPRVRILGIANVVAIFGLVFATNIADWSTSLLGQVTSQPANISIGAAAIASTNTNRATYANDNNTRGTSYWYGRGESWWGIALNSDTRIVGGEVIWYNANAYKADFFVEGSNDGNSWTELTRVNKQSGSALQQWSLDEPSNGYSFYRYRFINNPSLSVIMEGRFFEDSQCGNGVVDEGEQCDDGNTSNDDNCSNACVQPVCGDGVVQTIVGETCDDGNSNNDDRCSNACTTNPFCGDRVVQQERGEECDDGNDNNEDGCSNRCILPSCGDGVVQSNEECDYEDPSSGTCNADCTRPVNISIGATAFDDQNYRDPNYGNDDDTTNYWYGRGDTHWGITLESPMVIHSGEIVWYSDNTYHADFVVEGSNDGGTWTVLGSFTKERTDIRQWALDTPSAAYTHFRYRFTGNTRWTVMREGRFFGRASNTSGGLTGGTGGGPDPVCGNGTREGGEQCDDGNTVDNDNCSNSCIEALCGDGALQQSAGEECDDGNNINADDCTNECKEAACGDRIIQDNEVCDDGVDTGEGDGCPGLCQMKNICGNGVPEGQNYEECDKGVDNSDRVADACRTNCIDAHCGDGVVDTGEECDDGNRDDRDSCRNDCTAAPVCGDGIVDNDEECDDGNTDNSDSCRNDCTNPVCGDGIVDNDEECDDGNTSDGDMCAADCTLAPVVKALQIFGVDDIHDPEPANDTALALQILDAITEALRSPNSFDFNSNGNPADEDDRGILKEALRLILGIESYDAERLNISISDTTETYDRDANSAQLGSILFDTEGKDLNVENIFVAIEGNITSDGGNTSDIHDMIENVRIKRNSDQAVIQGVRLTRYDDSGKADNSNNVYQLYRFDNIELRGNSTWNILVDFIDNGAANHPVVDDEFRTIACTQPTHSIHPNYGFFSVNDRGCGFGGLIIDSRSYQMSLAGPATGTRSVEVQPMGAVFGNFHPISE